MKLLTCICRILCVVPHAWMGKCVGVSNKVSGECISRRYLALGRKKSSAQWNRCCNEEFHAFRRLLGHWKAWVRGTALEAQGNNIVHVQVTWQVTSSLHRRPVEPTAVSCFLYHSSSFHLLSEESLHIRSDFLPLGLNFLDVGNKWKMIKLQ